MIEGGIKGGREGGLEKYRWRLREIKKGLGKGRDRVDLERNR